MVADDKDMAWDAGRSAGQPPVRTRGDLERLVAAHAPGGQPMSAHHVCENAKRALALVRGEQPAEASPRRDAFSPLTAAECLVYAQVFGAAVVHSNGEHAAMRAAAAVLELRRADARDPNDHVHAILRRFKEGT